MTLHIIFPSGNKAVLGTFVPLNLKDVKRYMMLYPRSWIEL